MATSKMASISKLLAISKQQAHHSAKFHSMAKSIASENKKLCEKLPFTAHRCMSSSDDDGNGSGKGSGTKEGNTITTQTTAPRRVRRNDAEGVYGKFVQNNPSSQQHQRDNYGVPKLLIYHHQKENAWNQGGGALASFVGGKSQYPRQNNNRPLPTLDASPLLDATHYIKRKSVVCSGTTTVSGTDGARRLLRGRRSVDEIIRTQLLNREKPGRAFALAGHGVPQALLEDHLLLAEGILDQNESAIECSFMNTLEWMLVRSGQDGSGGNAVSWPPRDVGDDAALGLSTDDIVHRLDLFLAVMNRIASIFGAVIDPAVVDNAKNMNENTASNDMQSNHNENNNGLSNENDFVADRTGLIADMCKGAPLSFSRRNRYASSRLRHWRVFFLKGETYPSNVIKPAAVAAAAALTMPPSLSKKQSDERNIQSFCSPPIVELTQIRGSGGSGISSASAHVRVTLQGTPPATSLGSESGDGSSQRYGSIDHGENKKQPVTVVFDACFGEPE